MCVAVGDDATLSPNSRKPIRSRQHGWLISHGWRLASWCIRTRMWSAITPSDAIRIAILWANGWVKPVRLPTRNRRPTETRKLERQNEKTKLRLLHTTTCSCLPKSLSPKRNGFNFGRAGAPSTHHALCCAVSVLRSIENTHFPSRVPGVPDPALPAAKGQRSKVKGPVHHVRTGTGCSQPPPPQWQE